MKLSLFRVFFLSLCFTIISCVAVKKTTTNNVVTISQLKLLSEKEVAFNQQFMGTTIGGLSGIDYNPALNEYYMICDDRSALNPARFYTAKLSISNAAIDSVMFTNVTNLLQPNGTVYPDTKQDPENTPDPEALRFNKKTNHFTWTSEGERIVNKDRTVLADPTIISIAQNGKFIDSFTLPPQLHMSAAQKGLRQNGTLEGLTFADDYKTMYVSMEEPLYEDGPLATTTLNNPWIRILKYDMATRLPTAQYAYKLEPVAYPSIPAEAFQVNGIADILSTGNNKLLVIERSFSSGRLACTIKVFLTDLNGASDVSQNNSILQNPPLLPAQKKLLLNMDSLGIYTDNIEGVTFGPTLPNGHQSLIFVSDNNFLAVEKTQFLLFEIIP